MTGPNEAEHARCGPAEGPAGAYAPTTPHPLKSPAPSAKALPKEGLAVVPVVRPRQDSNLRPSA